MHCGTTQKQPFKKNPSTIIGLLRCAPVICSLEKAWRSACKRYALQPPSVHVKAFTTISR